MSGVDVLAVLDDLVADMGDTPGTTGHQVAQVRADVAELIKKSTTALHYMRLHAYADQAWADDLEASLARCRGGAR